MRIGLDKLLDPLLAFFHIRFNLDDVLSVGQQSKVCRLNTVSYITEMIHLVSLWDGSIDEWRCLKAEALRTFEVR